MISFFWRDSYIDNSKLIYCNHSCAMCIPIMGKTQDTDQQIVSNVAALVTDELLLNETFRNIIQQCVLKVLINLDKLMKDLII